MEHVDEGTIHAWLDGALAGNEGERIAAHIAGCASCAAAVAEARGLIAASSRILSALDDVPGGVIPRRGVDAAAPAAAVEPAHASPAGAPARGASPAGGARPPVRRPWYRRPQYAAAAGIAFVALTTTVLLQRVGVPSAASDAEVTAEMRAAGPPAADSLGAAMAAADVAAPQASPPAASQAAASQAATAPPAESVAAAVSASALERAAAAPRAAKLAATEAAPPATSASANDAARAAGAAAAAATAAEPRVAAARREASNEAVQRVAADVAVPPPDRAREAASPPVPVPSAVPPAVAVPRAAAAAGVVRGADSAGMAKRTLALSADSVTRAERLRLAGERDVQLQSVVVTGASEARRAPSTALAPAARTPATLAGCYQLLPMSGTAASVESGRLAALERVELVFAAAGVEDARPAYVARDLAAPDAQPALRWTLTGSGQVLLLSGEGATLRRQLLAIGSLPDAALAAGTRRAVRVDCASR